MKKEKSTKGKGKGTRTKTLSSLTECEIGKT